MKKILFIAFAFYATFTLFSQTKGDFKYSKVNNGIYETVFTVLGIDNENTATSFIKKLEQEDNVISAKIFYNRRCKVFSKEKLNLGKVREIAKQYNSDVDLGYCTNYDKLTYSDLYIFKVNNPINDYSPKIIPGKDWVFPNDFPSKSTINDELELRKAKQKWIEDNPYKWREITGVEYLDYSIRLGFKNKIK